MDCNKEEAARAMKLAEKKMEDSDFVPAQKLAQKAQRLYPEIENISRMITVCEVHCSSLDKLGGSEMDWYKILQIEQSADMAAIKKQYRKLAFQLHPDKNKFAGAEAAFKLIADANRTLSDEWKRSAYDRKHRDLSRAALEKPTRAQQNGKTSVQNRYGNSQYFPGTQMAGSYSTQQPPTFWTRCPFCSVSYQYYRTTLGSTMVCYNCQKQYVAEELSVPAGAPPSSFQNFPKKKKEAKKPVPKPSPSLAKKKPYKNASTANVSSQPMSEENNALKSNGVSGSGTEERDDGDVKDKKQGVEIPKPSEAKPESSKNPGKKRARKSAVVSSDSEDDDDDVDEDVNGSAEFNRGSSRRRSSRQKQNISYQEKVIDSDDDFVSPPKRSRVEKSASAVEEETNGHKKGFEKSSSSPIDGDLPTGDKSESNMSETDEEEEPAPEIYSCPDPDFSDFDKEKAEGCFAVDQVWAIYDPEDGMPRFYARIKKVCTPGFKLNITWLEAKSEKGAEKKWIDEDLPVACGKYGAGKTDDAEHGMFSHQMHCIRVGKRSYLVHPRKGETWAIFRDWDINWSSDPEKHKPFNLDFVEILTDFDNSEGVIVGYLERVKGFVSIFWQNKQDQCVPFRILPGELLRFSHRVPSFQMTGTEREGVPKGSYELDPAAMPSSFFESCDVGDQKKDDDVSAAEVRKSKKPESESLEREVPKTRQSPRKSKADGHGNLTPSKQKSTVSQADEKINTPKRKESHAESESFRPRKSPRDFSKKTSEINGSHSFATEESFPKQTQPEKVEHVGSSTKPKSSGTPNGKIQKQPYRYDFSRLASKDKFKQGQIWALRTNDDPFPRTYGLVKKVDSELQPHLVMLYPCSGNKKTRPVCCGTFKSRREKPAIYEPSSFSHCVTFKANAKSFEIYPCKGDIWAVHKNQSDDSECDVVAVMEDGEQSTKVVVLSRIGGSGSIFKAQRTRGSKIPLDEIPRSEISRFSHQIPATQNMGSWELDPKSIPDSVVICLD